MQIPGSDMRTPEDAASMSSTPPETPLLEFRLFGQPSVLVQGKDITRSLPKKAVLLLALLVLRNEKPIERHQLAGMLWPEVPEKAALHNLRQMLAGIRRTLGEAREVIESPTPRSLSFKIGSDIRIDALEFDAACACSPDKTGFEQAMSLYREPLLAGWDEPFVQLAREARQNAFLSLAEKLVVEYFKAKDHAAAITVLRRVLAEDPYRESACRAMMTALAEMGQRPGALEFYREFRERLRRDLRVDVGADTKALYREIRKRAGDGAQRERQRSHVPTPLTELVGRKEAIADVLGLLRVCRLVTLTGVGGVGKTRLSIAVAEELTDTYLDGAYFVDLAPVQNPETIPMAVASALNLKETAGTSLTDAVLEFVAVRELLLVLDNCEHLSEPLARIVEELLIGAPGLRVLATSRQTLGVRGETAWSVPSLQTAAPSDHLGEMVKVDAVRLFLNRSRRPIDESKAKDIVAIASICRRLDGLPLAIELAAARTNVFLPSEIERRLDDRFVLLTTGSQKLDRHQTLLACMTWSWEMLCNGEKHLLMAMSAFRGGCGLEALASVSERGGEALLELLDALVDKSLVTIKDESEQPRYTLLETVREFADQKLKESGVWANANDRHRDYFLDWVEEGYRRMSSVEEAKKFAAFELEHDNLRGAIAWCDRQGERAKAIRMCAALSRFWDTHGHLYEGRAQLEYALSFEAPELSEETRSRALVHAGWMASVQGECALAIERFKEALQISAKLRDEHARGVILNCLSNAYIVQGDYDNAKVSLLESLARAKKWNPESTTMILCNLAEVAFDQTDDDEAARWLEHASLELGHFSLEQATLSGTLLRHLAFALFRKGEFAAARSHVMRSLHIYNEAGILFEIPFALTIIGLIDARLCNWSRALALFGAADRALKTEGTTCPHYLSVAREECLESCRRELLSADIDAHLRGGKAMDLATAVTFAMGCDS